MSEKLVDGPESVKYVEDSLVQEVSGGAMLRKAREASGLQLAALAVSLKVPIKKLEALEADRFDLLPDTVFVRALTASVCRSLKIDAAPILERLPQTTTPSLKTDESGINTPFRSSGTGTTFAFLNQLSKPFVFAILALFVGAALLVFLPQKRPDVIGNVPKTENLTLNSSISSPTSEPASAANFAASESIFPVQSVGLLQSGSAVVVTTNPASGAGYAVPIVTSDVDVSTAVSSAIVFKARDATWVEVIDAKTTVQVRKTMAKGEVIAVSGALPLAVIVGRASNMYVQVRGQPFDLSRLAKDNVARFEVK
jgi:cytoskeleton protein RodZ